MNISRGSFPKVTLEQFSGWVPAADTASCFFVYPRRPAPVIVRHPALHRLIVACIPADFRTKVMKHLGKSPRNAVGVFHP